MKKQLWTTLVAAGLGLSPGWLGAAETPGLSQKGKLELQSAGALTFGPPGVLFVGDSQGAAVVAIGVDASAKVPPVRQIKVTGLDASIASLLGTTPNEILINDLAVQPGTGLAFLSVSRGKGPAALPAIVRVDGEGRLTDLPLDNVDYARTALNNAPAADAKDQRGNALRQEAITDLAFIDGKVYVAGLSNEEFASKLRAIPFPFQETHAGASVEIYHGAHGKYETRSPVRTFVPLEIEGQANIVAAYTCTPLVKFPVSDLQDGKKVQGTTVAELGNRNRPLDLIVYKKDGKNHLLVANSARGVLKVSTENIDKQTPITSKVEETAGLAHQAIEDLKGVEQLDKLNDQLALVLIRTEAGSFNLESVPLP